MAPVKEETNYTNFKFECQQVIAKVNAAPGMPKTVPMEDALQMWEEKFQNVTDHAADAKALFFVELVRAEFEID